MIIDKQEDVTAAVLSELARAPDARFREVLSALVRHLHAFAFRLPTLYGFMTVAIAVAAGLLASTVFRKSAH